MLTGVKDLDIKILGELEDVDLVNICQVNKQADEICKDQGFWLNRIMLKFPYLSLDVLNKYKDNRSWSEYYINDLRKINLSDAQSDLSESVQYGRLDHMIMAINNGADINYSKYYIVTAGEMRHRDVFNYLINQGIDIRTDSDAPLRFASENGWINEVKYLINQGADVHADGDGAVRWASYNGHIDVVRYLVNQGANIHADDDNAVILASEHGELDMVKYLVSLGANIRARNDEAVKYAKSNGHTDVVDYLVNMGAPRP